MAKKAQVKLTNDSDWQEVEVANFYDPSKHNTVRLSGDAKKVKYHKIKMEDGRVYNKESNAWETIEADVDSITVEDLSLPLPYKDTSVKNIVLNRVLERCDNVVEFITECHRVLIDTGKLNTILPVSPSHLAFSDPEFKNYFNESTLRHFHKDNRYGLFSNYVCTVRGETLDITLKK